MISMNSGSRLREILSRSAFSIAAGPDGAMWFTGNLADNSNFVARITTAGKITFYPTTNAGEITAGPDGAMGIRWGRIRVGEFVED